MSITLKNIETIKHASDFTLEILNIMFSVDHVLARFKIETLSDSDLEVARTKRTPLFNGDMLNLVPIHIGYKANDPLCIYLVGMLHAYFVDKNTTAVDYINTTYEMYKHYYEASQSAEDQFAGASTSPAKLRALIPNLFGKYNETLCKGKEDEKIVVSIDNGFDEVLKVLRVLTHEALVRHRFHSTETSKSTTNLVNFALGTDYVCLVHHLPPEIATVMVKFIKTCLAAHAAKAKKATKSKSTATKNSAKPATESKTESLAVDTSLTPTDW